MTRLTVATWNAEWRVPGSADAALIRERLASVGAGIICLTEAYANIMGSEGHLIESEPDYGYPVGKDGARCCSGAASPGRRSTASVTPSFHRAASLPGGR